MNNLTPSHLKDTITSTLQEILATDPNFFLPNQLKILSWKSKKINGALITKIGNRRYLGLLRQDKNGQEYWKYKPLLESSSAELSTAESLVVPTPTSPQPLAKENNDSEISPTDNIAKFQQRQIKTQEINHG